MIGIYLITNKITNQHYVGQSIDIKNVLIGIVDIHQTVEK